MDARQRAEVASALDATPELLPYLDELLADLWELGCSRELIVETLRGMRLPPDSTRVLDVACGKGAVALGLAAELGYRVEGVDLYEPFIVRAVRRARALGLADRCRFRAIDMRQAIAEADGFDVVVYSSVGALGAHDRAVDLLRQAARPGGLIVIDDGFLRSPTGASRPGYEHYTGLERTRRRLTAAGDRLVHESILPAAGSGGHHDSDTELIRRRAGALAKRFPEAADLLHDYVRRQEQECEFLERFFVGALWILERPASSGEEAGAPPATCRTIGRRRRGHAGSRGTLSPGPGSRPARLPE